MEKLESKSLDLIKVNIEKLKELFPNVVTEGKIDFDILRLMLGDEIEHKKEKYQFTWVGKNQSIKIAQLSSSSTLRPDKKSSKNWDFSNNLYIEGDNLEVLKQLQKTYYGKIKMIYIDPPYNTGNDFVYKDKFEDSISNYLDQTNQKNNSNPETSGKYHTNWLNMIYPRLLLAKNLLAEDGVIFISIDENEADNLKKVCDEIFGADNYRNQLLVRRRIKSLNVQFAENGLKSFNVGFEYVFVYSKTQKFLFEPIRMKKQNAPTKGTWNVFWSNADRPTMRYEILGFTPESGQWRWQKELADEAVENYKVFERDFASKMSLEEYWKKTGEKLRFVRRIEDGYGKNGGVQYWVGPSDSSLRTSNWTDIEVSQIAKEYDLPFENPKNVNLISTLISSIPGKDFTIIDFFSGSSTTADAILKLNQIDGGNRKFIMIQLPEPINDSKYDSICELGKERIRQAGDKIYSDWENSNKNQGLFATEEKFTQDIGFKVFKLDSTNIKPWDNEIQMNSQSLFDLVDVFKEGRSKEDVLYEIMLKYGVFDMQASKIKVNGKTMYRVGKRYMIVCLEDNVTSKDIEAIGELSPRTVIFKESGFNNDNDKINAVYNLEKAGVEDVKCI